MNRNIADGISYALMAAVLVLLGAMVLHTMGQL